MMIRKHVAQSDVLTSRESRPTTSFLNEPQKIVSHTRLISSLYTVNFSIIGQCVPIAMRFYCVRV